MAAARWRRAAGEAVRQHRGATLAIAASVAAALAAQAPAVLRRVGVFDVERVEVVGTRYLAPQEALGASGITRTSSVFDDPAPWRAALLRHPLVAEARIRRKLPSTVVLEIREVEPVALARTPVLRPVDEHARVLPIDPAGADLDLPVVGVASPVGEDGRLAERGAIALVEAIARIRRLQPSIADRVSEVAPAERGGIRLLLREPGGAEVLLPADPGPERLEQLRLTVADLESRAELRAIRRIDVRFRDQVVVSPIPRVES